MKYDLDLTFGEIFNNDRSALLKQLIDIQHHKANREAAERWAEKLRFIDISNVPSLSHLYQSPQSWRTKTLVLPLTDQQQDDGGAYVAVSWRWIGCNDLLPWGCENRESFSYMVQRPGKDPHKSKFPNHYIERAILYAQAKGITKLWVDIECIYQRQDDGEEDKTLGVQIMDVVYGESNLSLGLLTTGLIHQSEVTLLAELLSGSIFVDFENTEDPSLKLGVEFLELQTLILRILSDARWSRGWIFQEDHLASGRMTLLVPHANDVNTKDLPYPFGKIPGNLQVKVSAFRKAVTMFCLANRASEFRWPNTEMLAKAKQYNIWNREVHKTAPHYRNKHSTRLCDETDRLSGHSLSGSINYSNESVYPSTISSILEDICHRDLLKMEDRVAIMANAAKFSTRLDISLESVLVKSEDYSLSTILLALILLNGEILSHDMENTEDGIMAHTVRSYLEEKQYKFNEPMLRYQQSRIDHCRFKSSTLLINERGVEVQGFLFVLLPRRWPYSERNKPNPLKLSVSERDDLGILARGPEAKRIEKGRYFSEFAAAVIRLVASKLQMAYGEDCRLARFLERHLELDITAARGEEPKASRAYAAGMLSGLVQALLDEREVRLARLEDESHLTPPSGIFIAPLHNDGWVSEYSTKQHTSSGPRGWIFTSWDNGVRNTRLQGMEQLASLEVLLNQHEPFAYLPRWDPDQADNMVLRSCGWVNGVYDVEGKRLGRYTFPIAGLTEPPRVHPEGSLGKRKRDDGIEDSATLSDGGED
jgi:hypothetical protein